LQVLTEPRFEGPVSFVNLIMVKSGRQDLMVVLAADRRVDVEKLEKITGYWSVLKAGRKVDEIKGLTKKNVFVHG
jgi:hypothetical protein